MSRDARARRQLDQEAQHPGAEAATPGSSNSRAAISRRWSSPRRWSQKPKLIIFDEPTRGVDVGAIAEIHQLIAALADEGLAVIVISSYLPEILSLSDRILVSRQGRIVEELSPREATSEAVMFAAVY